MPDPTRQTVSATEIPALFGVSSWATRWMLYHHFRGTMKIVREPTSRMEWGTKMQPLVLEQVARERKLEVIPNEHHNYIRNGLLGCTRDAVIVCPDRGPGALEIKCVFDYRQWNDAWGNGNHIPREYEIQLQQQMFVGDGNVSFKNGSIKSYDWGLLAVWVCAEMFYFERLPIYDLWKKMVEEARKFFLELSGEHEPPKPFGDVMEIPGLTKVYATQRDTVLDLSNDYAHVKTSEDVSMYKHLKDTEAGSKYASDSLKAQLLAMAEDYYMVKLPCGVSYTIVKSGTGKRIKVYVPENPLPPPPAPETGALIG